MTFQQYLDQLDAAVRTGGNFRTQIIDKADEITDNPTREQMLKFFAKLGSAILTESGRMGGAKDALQASARGRAIELIKDFVESGAQGVFANINPYKFAMQLALRVRSPRIINQHNTTLCGPVAMVYDVAKRDPEKYARFAISLFTTGTGQLSNTAITPSDTIRNGHRSDLLPEVDYVVLASIRGSDAVVLTLEPLRNILTLTKPGALCEFMRQSGFTNIQDHSFLTLSVPLHILNALTPHSLYGSNNNSFDRGWRNLQTARAELQQGRFVVMNADVAVAGAFFHGQSSLLTARTDQLPAAETHWTAIRKMRFMGNNVYMKLVTWGGSFEGAIKKDVLLSRYSGYISADP